MAKSSLLRALYENDRDVQKVVDASLNCLEVEQSMVDLSEAAFQGAGAALQAAGVGRVARKHHQPLRIVLNYGNVLQVAKREDPVLIRAGGGSVPHRLQVLCRNSDHLPYWCRAWIRSKDFQRN